LLQGAAAAVPMGVSFACMAARNGCASTRRIVFQPAQLIYLRDLYRMSACWFLPLRMPAGWWRGGLLTVSLVGLVLLAYGLWCALRARIAEDLVPVPGAGGRVQEEQPATPWLYLLTAGAYLGFLVVSMIGADPPATPLETRLLALVMPMVAVLAAWAMHRATKMTPRPAAIAAGLTLVLASLAVGDVVCVQRLLYRKDQRFLMFASEPWTSSPTAKAVRGLPENATIFSNSCDALYYLTGRNAIWVPKIYDPPGQPSPRFADEVRAMRSDLERSGGYIVMFNDTWYTRFGGAQGGDLATVLPLEVVADTADGAIYRVAARILPP
jgi:hypothetical protein